VEQIQGTSEAVSYRHFTFRWERRWANNGARRLQARGDPRGLLKQGREAYGYLVCASVWGFGGWLVGVFIFLPTLIASGGMTLAGGVELVIAYLLLSMCFMRVIQAKRTARKPAT